MEEFERLFSADLFAPDAQLEPTEGEAFEKTSQNELRVRAIFGRGWL